MHSVGTSSMGLVRRAVSTYLTIRRVLLFAWKALFQWPILLSEGAGSAGVLASVSGAHLNVQALGKFTPTTVAAGPPPYPPTPAKARAGVPCSKVHDCMRGRWRKFARCLTSATLTSGSGPDSIVSHSTPKPSLPTRCTTASARLAFPYSGIKRSAADVSAHFTSLRGIVHSCPVHAINSPVPGPGCGILP